MKLTGADCEACKIHREWLKSKTCLCPCDWKIDCIGSIFSLMCADFACQLRPARLASPSRPTVLCEIERVGINYAVGSQNNSLPRATTLCVSNRQHAVSICLALWSAIGGNGPLTSLYVKPRLNDFSAWRIFRKHWQAKLTREISTLHCL